MPAIAFSFAKKAEPKRVVEALVKNNKEEDKRVSVVAVEAGQVTVDKPVEAAKQLSIPCKNPLADSTARSKPAQQPQQQQLQKAQPPSSLQESIDSQEGGLLARNVSKLSAEDQAAVQALCQEAGGEDAGSLVKANVMPILMRAGSKAARAGNEAEASKEMFDAVPVENFGLALLRGMGFDPEKHTTKPVYHDKMRDSCLGLGAKALLPSEKLKIKAKVKGSMAGKLAAPSEPSKVDVSGASSVAPAAAEKASPGATPKESAEQEEPQQPPAEKRRRTAETEATAGPEDIWPVRGLLVRMCSREQRLRQFKGCEAVVLEVDEVARCCRVKARLDDQSHALQGVPVATLEPVLSTGCRQVRVVRGMHRGAVAEVLHRRERPQGAVVRVSVDGAKVELPTQDVCEFVSSKR